MPLVDSQVLARKLLAADTTPEARDAILSFTKKADRSADVMDESQIAPVLAHVDSPNYDKAADQEPFLVWGLKQTGAYDAAKPLDEQLTKFASDYQIPMGTSYSAESGKIETQQSESLRDRAEKHMKAFFAESQKVSPWFEKTKEEQRAEAVAAENKLRVDQNVAMKSPRAFELRKKFGGIERQPVNEYDPKEVQGVIDAKNTEEFWKSPKLVRAHFSADLPERTERMAYLIGASVDPEKMTNAMHEQLSGLPADELAKVLLLARATNPSIDAGMLRRIADSAFSPAVAIGSQVVDWLNVQGMSMSQYRDSSRTIYDQLSAKFGKDYQKIWAADGTVKPEFKAEYDDFREGMLGFKEEEVPLQGFFTNENKRDARRAEFDRTLPMVSEDGKRWRDKDRIAYFADQSFGRQKFDNKGDIADGALSVVEGISYMTTLLAASAVPAVGPGLSFGLVYASQQSQDQRKLMYENGVSAKDAEALSSISAAFIAAIEYQQVMQVERMVKPKMYIGPQTRGVYLHAIGEYMKRVGVTAIPETTEEILQNGISFGLMAAAKYGAKAQGVDLSEEEERMWEADMQAVLQMPLILAGSGLMIRGAVAGKAGVQGGFKAGLRELTPVEIARAIDDSVKTPQVFMADQKARRAAEAARGREQAIDLIPQSDLETYRSFQNDRANRSGSSVITPKQNADGTWAAVPEGTPIETKDGKFDSLEAWMESKGYDPVNDRALFEAKDAHQESVRARADEANAGFVETLAGVEEGDEQGTEMVDIRLEAAIKHAESIGLKVHWFDTEKQAVAKFPAFGQARAADQTAGGMLLGSDMILVKENIKDAADALTVTKREIAHRRVAANPNKGNILGVVRSIYGDENLRAMLPEYVKIHKDNNDAFADEYFSHNVLATLDTVKGRAALEERGFMNKLRAFVKDVYGLQNPGEMAAKRVIGLALDVMDYNAAEAAKATAGVAPMDLKVGGRKYQRSATGEWSTKGSVIRDAETVAMLNGEASKQEAKNEARRAKEATARAEKRVAAIADADPVISWVLRAGGVAMPEGKEKDWPDEYRAIPKRFRGVNGGGEALDSLATAISNEVLGDNQAIGDDELRAALEAFEAKAERVMQDASDPELSAQEEDELIRDLESGKITQAEFDAAMNELSGARFSVSDENVNYDRLKELGFTKDLNEAGYVTPAGKLIDLSGKKEGGPSGSRSYDHREAGGTTGMQEFMAQGNIRMDYFTGSIDLVVEPTPQQEKIIRQIVEDKDGYVIVDLDRGLGQMTRDGSYYINTPDHTSLEFAEGTSSTKVLGTIRRYFAGENFESGARFSIAPDSLGFYSPLEKAIDGFKQDTFTVDQLRGMIKNAPGVKQEELDDIGFFDWLDGLSGKVTKAQALEFVRNGGPQIQEVQKGDLVEQWSVYDAQNTWIEYAYSKDEAKKRADKIGGSIAAPNNRRSTETKFSQYQLAGGENYREVLLTLPNNTEALQQEIVDRKDALDRHIDEGNNRDWNDDEEAMKADSEYIQSELAAIRELRLKASFRSQHWDEPNVLAHIRLNDRTGPNGEKILFIEEIQSDWHQAGRKQGYAGNVNTDGWVAKLDPRFKNEWMVLDSSGNTIGTTPAKDLNGNNVSSDDAIKSVAQDESDSGVPSAPFKKSWSMLSFKRVLHMAAEQGYDSVAWTPGDVQAERYDLSKQVTSIGVEVEPDGTRYVELVTVNHGDLVMKVGADGIVLDGMEGSKGKPLSDVIGKDISEKIMAVESKQLFKGQDLKVGGEGMKGFYDQILPKEIQKYVGKMGGKVSTTKIATGAEKQNPNRIVDVEDRTDPDARETVEVWSLPITDAMRESVMQGQPRFSLAPHKVADIETNRGGNAPLLAISAGMNIDTKKLSEAATGDGMVRFVFNPATRLVYFVDAGFDDVDHGSILFKAVDENPDLRSVRGVLSLSDAPELMAYDLSSMDTEVSQGAGVSVFQARAAIKRNLDALKRFAFYVDKRRVNFTTEPIDDVLGFGGGRFSVTDENPEPAVVSYLTWDILHDTEASQLLKRARYHYKELGVDVPDKKKLQAMVAEAQEIALQTFYQRDTNGFVSDREMSKYVKTEAAKRWVLSKMAEVRRSAEKGGAIYEAARRDTIAKFERQSDSAIRKLMGYKASDLKDNGTLLSELRDMINLPAVPAPKPDDFVSSEYSRTREDVLKDQPDAELDADGDINAEIPPIPSDDIIFGISVREWMMRVNRAVAAQLQKDGIIRADISVQKAMFSSIADAAYRKTIQKMLLDESGVVNYAFGRDWIQTGILKLRDAQSIGSFENQAERLLVAINKYRVQETHQELTDKVWEIIKAGAKEFRKSRLAEVNRRLPGRVERLFKNIVEVMDMKPDAVVEKFDVLLAELNTSAEAISDQDAEDAKKSMLFALQRFGGFLYKELSDKKTAVEWLDKKMEDSLIRQEELREEMKAQTDKERKLISDTLRRGKLKGWGKRKFSDINTAGMFLQHRLQLLVGAGQGAAFEAGAKWADDFSFEIQGAAAKKTATVHRANADFVAAIRVLYNTDRPQDVIRDLMKKKDEFSKFSAVGQPMEKDAVLQQLATLAQERYRNAALVMIEIEQKLEAMYGADFRLALKDSTRQEVAEKLYTNPDEFYKYQSEALGVNLSDGQVLAALESIANGARMARRLEQEPEMLKAVSGADLALMDWMRDYYRKNRDELSKATADITGLEFEDNGENYLPVKIKFDGSSYVSVKGVVLPVVPASLSARQIHFRDLDETAGLLMLFVDRTKSNSQFLGFGKMHQRVNRIFGDPKLREDIALAHGEGFANGLKQHLTDTIAGDAISHKDAVIDQVVNFFAVSALAYNASLLPKQMTAISAYAMYGSVANMLKYSAQGMADLPLWWADRAAGKHTSDNPTVQAMHDIFDSDYAISRLQGGRTDIQRDVLGKLPGQGLKFWQAYAEKGMIFTKYGDMLSILTFGSGYYQTMIAEAAANGLTEKDGKCWALNKLWMLVEATQSSGQIANKAEWQRRMGSGGRLLGQFTGPQQGFVSKVVTDYRMLRFAMEGGDKARISAAWGQLIKSGVITVEMNMAYVIMGVLWNFLLGRIPDERDAEKVLVAMLTGPFAGAFFTGAFVQAFAEGVSGGRAPAFGSDLVPASGAVGTVRYGAMALNDLVTGDVDSFLKNLDRLGSRLNPVYRDARKVYKNYLE